MSSGTGEVDNESEDILFGDICMLHSLGKQEFNGKKGRIISEMDNGRFLVSFLDCSSRIKVKPINITRVSKRYNDAYAALQRDPGIEVLRRSVELPEAVRNMRHCASLDAVQEGDNIRVSAVPPTALAGPSQNDIERAEEGGAVRRYGQAAVLWAEGIRCAVSNASLWLVCLSHV